MAGMQRRMRQRQGRPRCRCCAAFLSPLLLFALSSRAGALTCIQRAFTLLAPCQSALGALADAGDITTALASLGATATTLPPAVKQCCAAVRPFSDALCVLLLRTARMLVALPMMAC
jgi:hypothetical protein